MNDAAPIPVPGGLISRIAILDTNAFNGDVYAGRQALTTLFDACDTGLIDDDFEVWTPKGVLGELVRQYPERLARIEAVLGSVKRDLPAFALQAPELPEGGEDGAAGYRQQMEERLNAARRRIAPHPADVGCLVDWAAGRRRPIRAAGAPKPRPDEPDLRQFQQSKTAPLYGVVDAAIWLTVIEATRRARRVTLISSNSKDFCDSQDPERPCELLREDLEAAGVNPDRVEVLVDPFAFNRKYVEALAEVKDAAEALLGDAEQLADLKALVAEAAEWSPLSNIEDFELGVAIDEAMVESLEVHSVELVRADPAPNGIFLALEASGEATIELGIRKTDAAAVVPEDGIGIYDWDLNESMVAAQVLRAVVLPIEARFDQGAEAADLMVSIEDILPG